MNFNFVVTPGDVIGGLCLLLGLGLVSFIVVADWWARRR